MTYGMQPQNDPTAVMGRRVGAYVIDSLLSIVVLVAILALTKDHVYTGAPSRACEILRNSPGGFSGQCIELGSRVYTWKGAGFAAAYGLTGLVSLANLVVLQGMTGASIGKMILGLRVVNAEGAACGVGRAFVRWLILIVLDGACFLIGLLVAAFTHPHRRVGDMAAGTYVVELASVGRPIPGTQPAPAYAYAQPGAPGGWSPPGAAPPPPATPGWGSTPPPAWGAPTDTPPPPAWGTPAAPPAAPPPPPSPTATPADGSMWSTPPAAPAPLGWDTPPPPSPPPPAAPPADTTSAPAETPPSAASVEPAPPPATDPAPPPSDPAPTDPAPGTEAESWWNKAFNDDDKS